MGNPMNTMYTRRSNVDTLLGLRKHRYLRAVLRRGNRYRSPKPTLSSRVRDWLLRLLAEREVPHCAKCREVRPRIHNAFRRGVRRHPGIDIE